MVRLAWWVGIYLAAGCSVPICFDRGFNVWHAGIYLAYPALQVVMLLLGVCFGEHGIIIFWLGGGMVYLLHLAISMWIKRLRTFYVMMAILILLLIWGHFSLYYLMRSSPD
jgi:hypothetical protein